MENGLSASGLPGVSIALIGGGRIAATDTLGVLEAGRGQAVTADTLFQAASVSKPVAALAALRLVDSGVLSLDADVNERLGSWHLLEGSSRARARVTLRQLLSHRAGTNVHGFRGYTPGQAIPSLEQVLDGLPPANSDPIRVTGTPGADVRYSGGGYCVLQRLLVEVTSRPFPLLLRERVLEPLAMSRSTFEQPLPAGLQATAARGHLRDGTVVKGGWHVYPEMAAAGLWTTPTDLGLLAIQLARAYSGQTGGVVSPATARAMLEPQDGLPVGLGWFLGGQGESLCFEHSGANEGFRARVVMFPRTGQGAAIMVNSDAGDVLLDGVVTALARAHRWPGW